MAANELILTEDWSELQLDKSWIIATIERFWLYALGAIILAFVGGYVISHQVTAKKGGYGVSLAIPDLPIVEPVTYRNVSKEEAKRINDAVKLKVAPIPAAAPFFITGSPESQARATDCLAATIYYEAGAEAIAGQMAVVQVVLNRVRHPAFPKSVCGVVFQGHERRTGCQFSYTCDGSMLRQPPKEAWTQFRNLARAMLNGVVYAPVGLATHYHTDWVSPYWSASLDKVRIERTHLFFRYNGYWGTPKAFRGRYAGAEAQYGKLARLSSVHGMVDAAALETTTAELPDVIAGDTATPQATDVPDHVSAELAPDDKSKEIFLIYVDPLLDPQSLIGLGARACGDRARCKVLAWADDALMPKGLPLKPQDRAAMAFSYVRTSKRAPPLTKWNCDLFPREEKQDCF